MKNVYVCSLPQLRQCHQATKRLFLDEMKTQLPRLVGTDLFRPFWSPCMIIPDAYFRIFPELWVQPSYQLCSFYHYAVGSGYGVIWALPTASVCPPLPTSPDQPTPPPNALPSVMDALSGDGSPSSYVAASLLARAFLDVQRVGNAHDWGMATNIINYWQAEKTPSSDQSFASALHTLRWTHPPPAQLEPIVVIHEQQISVRFYALMRRRFAPEITAFQQFTDHYHPGNYKGTLSQTVLATGPA